MPSGSTSQKKGFGAAASVGAGGLGFHEHHEKKNAKKEEEKATTIGFEH